MKTKHRNKAIGLLLAIFLLAGSFVGLSASAWADDVAGSGEGASQTTSEGGSAQQDDESTQNDSGAQQDDENTQADGTQDDGSAQNDGSVTVNAFIYDPQPAAMAEVQAAIDAWRAGTAGKPKWQYQVDESLMPTGWYCASLTEGGTAYWTCFMRAVPMSAAVAVDYTGLTNAISGAAAGTPRTITVMNDIPFSGVITVPAGREITITSATGANLTKQTGHSDRHFTVNGKLTLNNITLDGSSIGGGVHVTNSGGTSLTMNNGSLITNCISTSSGDPGGGVDVRTGGAFTMNGGEISNCESANGGGGAYIFNGTFNISGGAIKDNTASNSSDGGGVYVTSGSNFVMSGNAEISDNTATAAGGGVRVMTGSSFTISGGSILRNKANNASSTGSGGGIYSSGTLFLNDGVISGNQANGTGTGGSGGGVFVHSTAAGFTMTGGSITNNVAPNGSTSAGGGVYALAPFTMTGGEISGNSANTQGGGIFLGNDTSFAIGGGSGSAVIRDNKAGTYGGGVSISTGSSSGVGSLMTMNQGALIQNNQALAGSGGGVLVGHRATLNMNGDSAITGNTASTNGGGLRVGIYSSFTMNDDSVVSGNQALGDATGGTTYYGGGVCIQGGTMTMNERSAVTGNGAPKCYGGGVSIAAGADNSVASGFANDGRFIMSNGAVSKNTAALDGGGVYLRNQAAFTMNGGKVIGNEAGGNGGGIGDNAANSGTGTMVTVNAGEITGNTAALDGGGIFTNISQTGNTIYQRLYTGPAVAFSGNRAQVAYDVTAAFASGYSNLGAASTSIFTYALNNFDVNLKSSAQRVYFIVMYIPNGSPAGAGSFSPQVELIETALNTVTNTYQSKSYTVLTGSEAGFSYPHNLVKAWNTKADDSGINYFPAENITLTGSLLLYSSWKEAIYSVTYTSGGKNYVVESLKPLTSYTIAHPDTIGLGISQRYNFYDLLEWNTQPDGTGTSYMSGNVITVRGDLVLYALFQRGKGGRDTNSTSVPYAVGPAFTPDDQEAAGEAVITPPEIDAQNNGSSSGPTYNPGTGKTALLSLATLSGLLSFSGMALAKRKKRIKK